MAASFLRDNVQELHNPSTPSAQIAALKRTRNAIIGHPEKKQSVIGLGIIDALQKTLTSSSKARGKRRTQATNGSSSPQESGLSWSHDDEICLQSIVLLGSLAHGGSEFADPILSGSIIPALMAYLSPTENSSKTILATLRTLLALAEAKFQESHLQLYQCSSSFEILYAKANIRAVADVLAQKSPAGSVQMQTSLICQLITKTLTSDQQKMALASAGVIDCLGERIAAYQYWERLAPTRNIHSSKSGLPPVPSRYTLAHVLAATSAIVSSSRYRIARLIHTKFFLEVFPLHHPSISTEPLAQGGGYLTSYAASPIDIALPWIYGGALKNDNGFSKAFPALGSIQAAAKRSLIDMLAEERVYGPSEKVQANGLESSLVLWLIHIMRVDRGFCRIEAARLLVALYQAGFVNRSRAHMLSLLVVPLLVNLMDETMMSPMSNMNALVQEQEARLIREQAPRVLGGLIVDFPHLQRVAIDAGVVKKVCQLLKSTFNSVEIRPNVWAPTTESEDISERPASQKLGQKPLPVAVSHAMMCRESALTLVAALSERDDKCRKLLTEQGLIPRLIDSLITFNENFTAKLNGHGGSERLDASAGNTIPVIVAACKAARSMSRSVGLLRTSLIDAGLARPIYALLKHTNVEVVIAATDVVCNIITEFSPMRADLVDAGAIKTLCEHAHSNDPRLQIGSLWALKHFVQQCPNEFKIKCFEELGTHWLVQIIIGTNTTQQTNQPSRSSTQPQPSMGAANAAGERVEILNTVDDDAMSDAPVPSEAETDSQNTKTRCEEEHSETVPDQSESNADARLQNIKVREECEAARSAHSLDLQIQVQGMDFLRNFIEGPGAVDMIDSLFNTLTSQRVFELIGNKLRAAPPSPRSNKSAQDQLSTSVTSSADGAASPSTALDAQANSHPLVTLNSTALLNSALFVCVHIAAGAPRHRTMLLQQTQLLHAVLPLFNHQEACIRVTCSWIVSNLIWVDDASDVIGARQRAVELHSLGFEAKLREAKGDQALDVRERASTAWENLVGLVEGREGGNGIGGSGLGGANGAGAGGGRREGR